jgi:hypothetical protein
MNSGSGNEKLLPYLLAGNHSFALRYQSSYSLSDLTGFNRNYSSLQLPSGERFESSAGFDFYMVPMPQAGSTTRIVFTSNRDGRAQLYAMDASGQQSHPVNKQWSQRRSPTLVAQRYEDSLSE